MTRDRGSLPGSAKSLSSAYSEQRARDALEFDPLPPSPWVTIEAAGIAIKTNYSEPLSRALRSLPGNRWQPEARRWLLPFRSADALRDALPEINRLAEEARDRADEETRRREAERKEAAAQRAAEAHARDKARAASRPRSLRPEFLAAAQGRPLYALTLESIGDDTHQRMRSAPFGLGAGSRPRHAVAQVMGRDGRGGWVQAYLSGAKDYSSGNSIGSRGVTVTYHLEEGPIYGVSDPRSWRRIDRYFLRITNGEAVRMTEDEVFACLAN